MEQRGPRLLRWAGGVLLSAVCEWPLYFATLHAVRALEREYEAWTSLSAKLAVTQAVGILSVCLMWLFVGVFGVLGASGHGSVM